MYLVASASPGGFGFLVVVVFFVAAAGIFVAMSRSLRRMRSHVERGDFGAPSGRIHRGDRPEPPDPRSER